MRKQELLVLVARCGGIKVPGVCAMSQKRWACTARIKEDHGLELYVVSFCDVPVFRKAYGHLFFSAGANRISVYRCTPSAGIKLLQAFVDTDSKERYFCGTWMRDRKNNHPLIAVAGLNGVIKIVDCTERAVARSLLGHGNAVNDLKAHPLNSDLLFSASKDESVRLWNIKTGVPIVIFSGDDGHRDEVISLDVHALGNALASSGMDRNVRVWALDSDIIRNAVKASYAHTDKTPHKVFTNWNSYLVFEVVVMILTCVLMR